MAGPFSVRWRREAPSVGNVLVGRRLRSAFMATLIAVAAGSQASAETLTWEDGLCRSTVHYDSGKVEPRAVEGTVAILRSDSSVPLSDDATEPADIAKLRPDRFERECAAAAARMRGLALLPLDGAEALRTELARHIDDACAYGSAKMRGFSDPSALRRYRPAAGHCDRFIDALEGKADLTAVWRRHVQETCADNANPAECRRSEEGPAARPDGDIRTRIFLIGFGWGNCALAYTAFNGDGATRRDALREKLQATFKRAYRVREVCERP